MIPSRKIDMSKNIFLNCFIDIHIYSIFDYRTIIYQYIFVLITKNTRDKTQRYNTKSNSQFDKWYKIVESRKAFCLEKVFFNTAIFGMEILLIVFSDLSLKRGLSNLYFKKGCVSILLSYDDQRSFKPTVKMFYCRFPEMLLIKSPIQLGNTGSIYQRILFV